ncbi:MAG: methyltransferase domain-containing protein [Deltaproteobacteria bacterium]|nr:methyltransferase domain-containing protein [Deltaproteobacteria bacterium]
MSASFQNFSDFLNWWFKTSRLNGLAEKIFNEYYSSYRKNSCDYLLEAWIDRHLELENELETLRDKTDIKVLDIGCGTGSVSLYSAYILQGHGHVLGIDINKKRLYCGMERKKVLERELGYRLACQFVESSIISHPLKEKYDLIYLEEAFHHMEPRLKIVKNISNLLKSKGMLIISEVNAYNPFMQFTLMKKRGLKTIDKRNNANGKAYLYGDERILPARQVARLFRKHHLKIKSLRYFRVASSALAQAFDKKGINPMAFEKKILRSSLLSRLISVHYNIVLQKGGCSDEPVLSV